MITKFKIFENIEYLEEMDPYGEEDWDDSTVFLPGDEVIITPKLKEYDDILPKWFMDFIGKKTFIYDTKIRHNQRMVGMAVDAKFYVDEESKVKAYFIPMDCLEKVKKVDEGNEYDPYDEEEWDKEDIVILIRKEKFADGYCYFAFKKDDDEKILQNLNPLQFEWNVHIYIDDTKKLTNVEIIDLKRGNIKIENEFRRGSPLFREWSYEDLVKVFGENNITFE